MIKTVTVDQLNKMNADECMIIDIRDETAFEYGHIDGSVNIPQDKISASDLPTEKKLIIYCRSGIISGETAEQLCEKAWMPMIFRAAMWNGSE